MLNNLDFARFAANSYAASIDVVSTENTIGIPSSWSVIDVPQSSGINNATGFLARAYSNGTNEIVIAYAGTTKESGMELLDWTQGNVPAALGFSLAPQILDAARFYLDVLKANPGANITFTGHSLGGGLAS